MVDTSLAVKWILSEEYTTEARALLDEWERHGVNRFVPSCFACEFANVLLKGVRRGVLSVPLATLALNQVLASVVVCDFDPAIAVRALELAYGLGRSTIYDTQYLALAEREGCELWTADERFWNATKGASPQVRWIGEVGSP